MGADWATINLDGGTLTINVNKTSSMLSADKVVIAKVVYTLMKEEAASQDSANIAQAKIEFVIKFETSGKEEKTKEDE